MLCPILCDPHGLQPPGFPVLHHLLEFAETHVNWVIDAIQPSHPLSLLSPPAFNLSQHQGLFQWVSFSHQVAKVLELQHQSFKWIFRVAFKTMNVKHLKNTFKLLQPLKIHMPMYILFILWYGYTAVCWIIHPWRTCAFFWFLLQIKLLWTFVYRFLCERKFSFLWNKCQVQFLDLMVIAYLCALKKRFVVLYIFLTLILLSLLCITESVTVTTL